MAIPAWIMVFSAPVAVGFFWFVQHLFLQHGRILLRLDEIEWCLKNGGNPQRSPTCDPPARTPFRAGSLFEAHIYGAVIEMDEYRIGDHRFRAEDVVIDVGAHIGTFGYLCHNKGSRAVHCFEPFARNFRLLQDNLSSMPGVHLTRAAVWRSDCDYPVELTLSGPDGENTGAVSAITGGKVVNFPNQSVNDSSQVKESVSAIALDDILRRFDRVELLKIDCEGSEFPILLTSKELQRVTRIVGEIHEIDSEMMSRLDPRSRIPDHPAYRWKDLVGRLESLGFRVTTRSGDGHMCWFDARREPGNLTSP